MNRDRFRKRLTSGRLSRRSLLGVTAGGTLSRPWQSLAAAATPVAATPAVPGTPAATGQGEAILAIARDVMAKYHGRAAILRVSIDGQDVVRTALGESMTGVPATPDMHFRNGGIAIFYIANLLLQLVDQKRAKLDDTVAKWLPALPDADRVTLKMLANMTSGYSDYVAAPEFGPQFYRDPFKQWTQEDLLAIALAQPRLFAPGKNWEYAHTNYIILGQVLEKIGGAPLATLLREHVLTPLGLQNTSNGDTPEIPAPLLHAFSAERRGFLGIPHGTRFYEETTFWNPSWTLAHGAIQTSNIDDVHATAVAFGTGALLSPASHQAQISPELLGFGAPVKGCPTCHTLDRSYIYGLGIVLTGDWLLERALFAGFSVMAGYLPAKRIAYAAAATYDEQSFDDTGALAGGNVRQELFEAICKYLAPDSLA